MTDDLKRLLIDYTRYFNILREKEAHYAGNVPLDLHNLIQACNEAKTSIERAIEGKLSKHELDERLRQLPVPVSQDIQQIHKMLIDTLGINSSETDDSHGIDPLLQGFVAGMSEMGIEFPVTLTVNGVIVSGLIISNINYSLGLLEAIYGQKFSSEEKEEYIEKLSRPDSSVPSQEPFYIHLRDARLYLATEPFPSMIHRGIYWRGKLSSIDSWVFGTIIHS